MTTDERHAVATICLMAAFADGEKHDAERNRLKEVFDSLDTGFSPALYSDVLMGKIRLEEAAAAIATPALRTLAYEMAVGVCDADGQTVPREQDFLDRLRAALGLSAGTTEPIDATGLALATLPYDAGDDVAELAAIEVPPSPSAPTPADAAVDAMILKYAILNGGLELLPQSLATMAIVPLQMKMVYRVGTHYGVQLDQGHIRELLATVGVGMTSQVLETYARKLVGGFMKKATGKKAGKKLGKVAGTVAGAAMSFATTYALGHVARVYYAGGRTLDTARLKQRFSQEVERGKQLFEAHRPAVEESARTTDLSRLMTMVRG